MMRRMSAKPFVALVMAAILTLGSCVVGAPRLLDFGGWSHLVPMSMEHRHRLGRGHQGLR